MDEVQAATGFAGAVVITRDGEPLFEGAWGAANHSEGVAFTPDTPVDGASLAKTFVASGIWQLVSEGLVNLSDPVQEYVPSYPHAHTTLRHLLEHSAGIPDLDDPTGLTNLGVVLAIDSVPTFEPGSRFSYCNECFDVLALVTEQVTGQIWSDFLQERYLDPLDMDSTFLRPALFADWVGIRTKSYRLENGAVVEHDVYDNEPFYGSSNLYLSARDLSKWGAAQIRGEVLEGSIESAAAQRPRFSEGGLSSLNALNWFQATPDGPAYFDGHLRGFHSVLYWDRESGLVVAWVSNTLGARPLELQLTRELVRIAEGGANQGVPEFRTEELGSDHEPSAVEGVYSVEGLGAVSVSWADGIILTSVDGGPARPGYPLNGFFIPDLGVEATFTNEDGGSFQRIHWLSVFDSLTGSRQDG